MKSVLLIEDDKQLRMMVAEFLGRNGWQVLEADDGETGLQLARLHRPSAIVCDLLLPRLNGFQICASLRRERELEATKILAISGRGYAANQQMALEAGADEFLAKPIRPSDLRSTLDRMVEEGAAPSANRNLSSAAPSAVGRFWGVRGSVPVPGPGTVQYGGNTSCIELRIDDEIIVLDCGTGVRGLGAQLAAEFKDRPLNLTILLSHTHWDHIQGFPFFLPAYNPANHIEILGYEGARAGLAKIFSGQMESPYFPIGLSELPGSIVIRELSDLEFYIGKVKIHAAFMNHPGVCMGYRLSSQEGTIAYLPDNEPFYAAGDAHHIRTEPLDDDVSFIQAEDRKMIEFIRGVDVLIMDAQYDAAEYKTHVGWGHGCVDDVVRLAIQAQVKRLFLFHHDPNHDDRKVSAMTEHARQLVATAKSPLIVESAREGAEFRLGPERVKSDRTGTARLFKNPLAIR